MNTMRGALAAMLLSAGCGDPVTPVPNPTPGTSVSDAQGDWTDAGPYAACTVDRNKAPCGDASAIDVSRCDLDSLSGVPQAGLYNLVYRGDWSPPTISASSFRLSADGQLDLLRGVKPSERRVGNREFLLSSTVRSSDTLTVSSTLRGCRAEGPRLYGCYVSCRNGKPSSWGTFLAERWTPRAGEAEASGLRLGSETFVAQGLPVDVYVTQGHAYVVSLPRGDNPGGLSVFDVRDPTHPVPRTRISLSGDNYWNGVWAHGNALYVASADTGVVVFDLTDPAAPRLVRALPSGHGAIDVHTVFVEGERLYAMSTGPVPKTMIFDVRQPTEPRLLGEYLVPGAGVDASVGFPHDALAFDGRLYINHWSSGYLVVDVSDPSVPRKLGAFTYPYATSHANAVGRFGDRLIAFEGGESWGAHLRVLDVTDPAAPKRIGEYALSENISIHNMVLRGERLYLAHYQHGVRVLDVSVPERPREMAHFNTFRETDAHRGESFYDGAIGIRVPGDGFVYVIDMSRGLLVFPEP